MERKIRGLAAALILFLGAAFALGQSYPTKPVRLIVPFAPGGGLDVIARLIQPKLSENLGQAIVIDNRPGASGAIGLELTARARADGYTLIIVSASHVIHAALYKTSYDLFRDFAPVSQTSAAPYVLVIFPGLPAASLSEFVAYAKSNPGKLNYISSGHGTLQHLATELLAVTVGVKLVHVPYKGVAVGFPDLLAGRVHMIAASITSLAPLIRSKGVRPLGVTSTRRMALLPEVPTMIEAGIPVTVTQWHGLLAPAGTPQPVLERLHRGIAKVLQEPEVVSRLTADATEIVGSSPIEFAAYLTAEREQWAKVIQQAGIRAE